MQILPVSRHLRAFGVPVWAHKSLQWPLITFSCILSLRWDNLQQNDRSQATYYCQKPENDSVLLIQMSHFDFFFKYLGARLLKTDFSLLLMIQVERNRAKSYVTFPVFTQYQRCCMHCRKSTSCGPFWPIFVSRSNIFIPRFIYILYFWSFHIILNLLLCDNPMFWSMVRELDTR